MLSDSQIALFTRITTTALPQLLCFEAAARYTRRGSAARWLLFAASGLFFAVHVTHLQRPVTCPGWIGANVSGISFWTCVAFLDRLVARGWDYDSYRASFPEPKAHSGDGDRVGSLRYPGTRAEFAAEMASSRGVGYPWQIKNLPAWDESKGSYYIPPRRDVLIEGSTKTIAFFIAHNALAAFLHDHFAGGLHSTFFPGERSFAAEVVTRAILFVAHFARVYCMVSFFEYLSIVTAAFSDEGSLRFARPMFDSIRHTYTLRLFWGKFWHQSNRSHLEGMANLAARYTPGIVDKSVVARYYKLFWSFGLSGVLHLMLDLGQGIPLAESGAVRFFLIQAAAIMVEDFVQKVWRSVSTSRGSLKTRAVGYLWTASVLVWSTTSFAMPIVTHMTRTGAQFNFDGVIELMKMSSGWAQRMAASEPVRVVSF